MCSSVHTEEQTKLRQENASDPIFKHLRRVQVDQSITSFKKQSGLNPNVALSNWIASVDRPKPSPPKERTYIMIKPDGT